jgi:hypothetical protein
MRIRISPQRDWYPPASWLDLVIEELPEGAEVEWSICGQTFEGPALSSIHLGTTCGIPQPDEERTIVIQARVHVQQSDTPEPVQSIQLEEAIGYHWFIAPPGLLAEQEAYWHGYWQGLIRDELARVSPCRVGQLPHMPSSTTEEDCMKQKLAE